MINKLTRKILLGTLICACTLSLHAEQAPSEALRILWTQMEDTYLIPMGERFNGYYRREPEMFAAFMGATLQYQHQQLRTNPQYTAAFEALKDEALWGIRQIPAELGYRGSRPDQNLTVEELEFYFNRGLAGAYNETVRRNSGVDPAKVELPLILDLVADSGDSDPGSVNPVNGEDPDGVELLGQRPEDGQANGKSCPPTHTQFYLTVDSNNNNKDDTYLNCEYFESGRLKKQTPYKNGKLEGHDIGYTETAESYYLSYDYQYVNGKLDGVGKQWSTRNPHGPALPRYLSRVFPHQNGVPHGVEKQYSISENGERYVSQQITYKYGKRHGTAEYFATVPKHWRNLPAYKVYRFSSVPYENGKRHGVETQFLPDGRVDKTVKWVHDKRVN